MYVFRSPGVQEYTGKSVVYACHAPATAHTTSKRHSNKLNNVPQAALLSPNTLYFSSLALIVSFHSSLTGRNVVQRWVEPTLLLEAMQHNTLNR